ncbi:Putative Chitin synthase [Rhizopus microsporus]|nr:Putative Chitin synthase [Rhizopus microsporus]
MYHHSTPVITDLCSLPDVDDTTITNRLRTRYTNYQSYTAIGYCNIIAVNPFKRLAQNDTQTSEEYVTFYKNPSVNSCFKLDPHIFGLANASYFHMRRTGKGQVILLLGESGSGKTEIQDLIIPHLIRLGSNKKKQKIQGHIIGGHKVLNIFGSATSSPITRYSSRFGVYSEIHFNERGKVVGGNIATYLLEKSRLCGGVSKSRPSQGNFTVFYLLLAGTTPDEKQVLQLTDDPKSFNYLASYSRSISSSDAEQYNELKSMMRTAGFKKDHFNFIIQLLSAILHLGNLIFMPCDGAEETVSIKNMDCLELIAGFLGLQPETLKSSLAFKSVTIRKDTTTLILDADQATAQRDDLAQTLYSLLFTWLMNYINERISCDDYSSYAGILNLPGSQPTAMNTADFYQFCINYANEKIHDFMVDRMFVADAFELESEEIKVPKVHMKENKRCLELLERSHHSICALYNKATEKMLSGKKMVSNESAVEAISRYNADYEEVSIYKSDTGSRLFAIRHFVGDVTYNPKDFVPSNNNQLSQDFVSLFRGSADSPGSLNSFVVQLFSDENIAADTHMYPEVQQKDRGSASLSAKQRDEKDEGYFQWSGNKKTVLAQTKKSIDDLVSTFQETNLWSIFCIKPNNTGSSTEFDSYLVKSQVEMYGLRDVTHKMNEFYTISFLHQDFLKRYSPLLYIPDEAEGTEPYELCKMLKQSSSWTDNDIVIGITKVFLGYSLWHSLEERLRILEKEEKRNSKTLLAEQAGINTKVHSNSLQEDQQNSCSDEMNYTKRPQSAPNDVGRVMLNTRSSSLVGPPNSPSFVPEEDRIAGTYSPPNFPDTYEQDTNATEEKPSTMTPGRKRWLALVYALTFFIPSFLLTKMGGMKRRDVRIAWREKLALCFIITFMCCFVIWFLVFFGELICPHQSVFSMNELGGHQAPDNAYVAIRGEVFNLGEFASHHYPSMVPTKSVLAYAGTDASELFPIQVSDLCENVSPYVSLDYQRNYSDPNAEYHDYTYSNGNYKQNWYYDQMTMLRKNYKIGHIGWEMKAINDQAKGAYKMNGQSMNRYWAVINDAVYDLTPYILGGRYVSAPPNEEAPANISTDFLDISVVNLFWQNSGTDITEKFNELPISSDKRYRELACIRNLYFVGMVDSRNSIKCQFSTYFLLVITVCLCIVIFFKFLAALRIGSPRMPEDLEKFVICQVTCYTEDEDSLRKTIDSLATLNYNDKRKLIVVICDGMIVGSGNDRPTPRIVLDIFGVDPQVDPEPHSFLSVGEGTKKHNRAKVFSGLYQVRGHVAPYLVIVKVGAPNERQKPGNRGKRDSQLITMQFLNRVYYGAPMCPLQLELYHQMRNVIGVPPEFYEYVLMVDADTEVMPDGLNYLVSSMAHDANIIGVCGETTLANEKDTWVTMIQVYEYFISHHMIKAFESLFSTVSCLPGCFTMYRVRTVDGKRPLFVSNEVIEDYSVNTVDTLHKKNLLYLGEDRYLTTLLLKHFPNFKTKFNPDAHCQTNAPDTWNVLISQRRRWINSTVHNLGELVFLPHLCGFCCFSMRFVVMLDLISTLVQPALLGYLGFLCYKLATAHNQIPYITIMTLGCTYGIQMILFIMNRRWEYVAWFIVSILALPVFSFYIPIYAYWHFDDFSWGNTRIVVGEKGQKVIINDEGEFDPKSIPLITWREYEKMMTPDIDQVSQRSSYLLHTGSAYGLPEYTPNPTYYRQQSPCYQMNASQSIPGSLFERESCTSERSRRYPNSHV